MPTINGTSVLGGQEVYTITQAPSFVYIAIAGQSANKLRRQGYARLMLQRVVSEPHLQLAGAPIWGEGLILRPSPYPGTAVNNKLILYWKFEGMSWSVTY